MYGAVRVLDQRAEITVSWLLLEIVVGGSVYCILSVLYLYHTKNELLMTALQKLGGAHQNNDRGNNNGKNAAAEYLCQQRHAGRSGGISAAEDTEQTPAYVVEVNVDVVVKMETDLVLRQITDNADLTLVDGQPLIWISKLYGRPLKMKVSGSDLVPTLLQAAAKEGRSVFVLGGKEDAARKAAENIKARYPGLVMAGALSPSMGFEKKPEEVAYIREKLQR